MPNVCFDEIHDFQGNCAGRAGVSLAWTGYCNYLVWYLQNAFCFMESKINGPRIAKHIKLIEANLQHSWPNIL